MKHELSRGLLHGALAVLFLASVPLTAAANGVGLQVPGSSGGSECFNGSRPPPPKLVCDVPVPEDDAYAGGGGQVANYNGGYHHHVVDYSVRFSGGSNPCGLDVPVAKPLHASPFLLELSRYYRSRAAWVDWGLEKGWNHNYFVRLTIADGGHYRSAQLVLPDGADMNWVDPGPAGLWQAYTYGSRSLHMELIDEAADRHLVTDRWGSRYHFVPNTGSRPYMQYLCDWLEDANGNRITLTYDDGYLVEASDGFGRRLQYQWSDGVGAPRRITSVTLPDDQTITFAYWTLSDNVKEVHYPNGDVASYGFDADADGEYYYFNDPMGRPGSRKDRIFSYHDDTAGDTGRVRGVKDEGGHVRYVRREAIGPGGEETTTVEHDDGRAHFYEFNGYDPGGAEGFSHRVTDLVTGAVRQRSWDLATGLLQGRTDALGHTTTYEYDADIGLPTLETRPDGSFESWTYNGLNRVEQYRDRKGNTFDYEYDAKGNVVGKTYPDLSFELWTRDPSSGRVVAYQDRNGHQTSYEYDGWGNVARIVLPAEPSEPNPEVLFTNDVHGRVTSITDPTGRVTQLQYDAVQRLIRTIHPDATTEERVYGDMSSGTRDDAVGDAGLIVRTKDRNDNWTDFEYGRNDRLERIGGAPGEVLLGYDDRDRLVSRSTLGDLETFDYDAAGRLTSTHRVADAATVLTTAYEYDLLNRVVREVDPYGFTTDTVYGPVGRVLSESRQISDTLSAVTGYEYDGNGNLTARTDPGGNRRTFAYDVNDRLWRTYDPAPHASNFVEQTYDANGNRLSVRDQAGFERLFEYTVRDRLKRETDPTGDFSLVFTYHLDDTVASIANDGTGGLRTYTYDCCGRVATETLHVDGGAGDSVTSYDYDGNGNVVRTTDGEGHVWTQTYDERDRALTGTDPLGTTISYAYSDDGSLRDPRLDPGQGSSFTLTDPNGNSTTSVSDGVGRPIATIDAAGNAELVHYDELLPQPEGLLVGTVAVDRNGHSRATYVDGLRREILERDPLGHDTGMSYDGTGNLVQVEDTLGNRTRYEYDERDWLRREIFADAGVVERTYFDNGWLATRVDQEQQTTSVEYDEAGRVTRIQYGSGGGAPADVFAYDTGGRLVAATSGLYANVVTRAYDAADRLTVEGQGAWNVAYGYDRRSLTTSIGTSSGRTFGQTYTARGLLDRVESAGVTLVDHEYDDGGRLTAKALGNGTRTTIEYDTRDWITRIAHAAGPVDLQTFVYTHDLAGNRIRERSLTAPTQGELSVYDAADRLVSWKRKVMAPRRTASTGQVVQGVGVQELMRLKLQSWALDPLGNWTSTVVDGVQEDREHNEVNEVVSIDGQALTHDDNGNLEDDGTYTYEHDPNDLLRTVRRKVDGALVAEYAYDALGRRVSRVDHLTGETVAYGYDGARVVEELTASGEVVAAYAYGSSVDEQICRLGPSETHYYHTNANANVAALTDDAGAVVERYEYDAYGEMTSYDPAWTNPSKVSRVGNPYVFACRRLDPEAGHLYYRARYYSPRLGRFLERDPLGYRGGWNLYAYAWSNPVNHVDPFGLQPGKPGVDPWTPTPEHRPFENYWEYSGSSSVAFDPFQLGQDPDVVQYGRLRFSGELKATEWLWYWKVWHPFGPSEPPWGAWFTRKGRGRASVTWNAAIDLGCRAWCDEETGEWLAALGLATDILKLLDDNPVAGGGIGVDIPIPGTGGKVGATFEFKGSHRVVPDYDMWVMGTDAKHQKALIRIIAKWVRTASVEAGVSIPLVKDPKWDLPTRSILYTHTTPYSVVECTLDDDNRPHLKGP